MERFTRWSGIAGIAFVVLYITATYLIFDAPGGSDTAAQRAEYYADDANTIRLFVAMYLVVLAGLAFLWFMAGLRTRLRPAGEGPWFFAASCGVIVVASLFVAAAVNGVVPVNVLFADNDPELGPETIQALQIVAGLLVFVGAALAAAVFIGIVSRLGQVSGAFPAWLSFVGYGAAVFVAFSFLYLPALALYLWVLVVSIYLMVRPAPAPAIEMA